MRRLQNWIMEKEQIHENGKGIRKGDKKQNNTNHYQTQPEMGENEPLK